MRTAVIAALSLGLAVFVASCGGSGDGRAPEGGSPSATRNPEEQPDCRPGADHVPYDVRLPTYLPAGIEFQEACYSDYNPNPGAPSAGIVQYRFSNPDGSAGFTMSTVPAELSTQGMTPVELAGRAAYFQRTDGPAGSTTLSIQITLDSVTYTVIGTVGVSDLMTEEALGRVAESLVTAED